MKQRQLLGFSHVAAFRETDGQSCGVAEASTLTSPYLMHANNFLSCTSVKSREEIGAVRGVRSALKAGQGQRREPCKECPSILIKDRLAFTTPSDGI